MVKEIAPKQEEEKESNWLDLIEEAKGLPKDSEERDEMLREAIRIATSEKVKKEDFPAVLEKALLRFYREHEKEQRKKGETADYSKWFAENFGTEGQKAEIRRVDEKERKFRKTGGNGGNYGEGDTAPSFRSKITKEMGIPPSEQRGFSRHSSTGYKA